MQGSPGGLQSLGLSCDGQTSALRQENHGGVWCDVQRLHSLSDRAALALGVYKAQILFSLWKKTTSVQPLLPAPGQVWLLQAGDTAGAAFGAEGDTGTCHTLPAVIQALKCGKTFGKTRLTGWM